MITGRGPNRQIARTCGWLAFHRPGDRIILIGYSRAALAARSLAGVIDQVVLLRSEAATACNVRIASRHYRLGARGHASRV